MSNTKILSYTFGIIILFFIYSSFFTVDQTKQAIVLSTNPFIPWSFDVEQRERACFYGS